MLKSPAALMTAILDLSANFAGARHRVVTHAWQPAADRSQLPLPPPAGAPEAGLGCSGSSLVMAVAWPGVGAGAAAGHALVVVALVVAYLMRWLPEHDLLGVPSPPLLPSPPPPQEQPATAEPTTDDVGADEPEEAAVELVCDEAALFAWLREGGASIHPALTLSPPAEQRPAATQGQQGAAAGATSSPRKGDAELGVFAARAIGPDELLFSVPEARFALAAAGAAAHATKQMDDAVVMAQIDALQIEDDEAQAETRSAARRTASTRP
jgi:hypothetical protein